MTPLFIAEIGINHQGDMGKARTMIERAKEAGADIAKFQWYDPVKILGSNSPNLAEATRAQFSLEQHLELKRYCEDVGIEWCVSAFDATQIPLLAKAGMKRFKVASRAALNDDFLRAIARTGRPVFISCGQCDDRRLAAINKIFPSSYPKTLLYCVCEYPASIDRLDFSKMTALKQFCKSIGFSSHYPGIVPSLNAIKLGAEVIEHHVVLSQIQQGCDVNSSITFPEFAELVVRGKEDILTLIPVKSDEHVEWLRIQRSRPELYKYFRQDRPIMPEQQKKWWRNLDKNSVRLFLVKNNIGDYVGYVGFNPFVQRAGRAEFGMFILPEFQHRGYGTRAIKMLLERGFLDYNLSTIYSDVLDYPGEDRFSFYKGLGFEAYPKEHQILRYKKKDATIPSIKFFMTRKTWEDMYGQNGDGRLGSVLAASAAAR